MTLREARTKLGAEMRSLVRRHPAYPRDSAALVAPLRSHLVGSFTSGVWMLEAAALLLLMLACANIAALLLARTVARHHELSIRAALGAGRARLVRQLLTEAVLLSMIASTGGVTLAWVATRFIARIGDTNLPRIDELTPDWTLLLFGMAATVVTTLLFGLIPAVITSKRSVGRVRSSVPHSRSHEAVMRVLIGAELALAFVLVMLVGLLSKSYVRLLEVDAGFDPQHVLTLSLLPDETHYTSPAARLAYFDAVVDRVRAIPGVSDAAYASALPLSNPSTAAVFVREHPLPRDADAPNLDTYLVSTNYLDVMPIPVRRGRGFSPRDTATSAPVAAVSESTARTLFAGDNPIGRHLQIGSHDDQRPWATIVGVVGDVHQQGLDREPGPAVYVPLCQVPHPSQGWSRLVVRSAQRPEDIESAVRAAMVAVDPLQPIFHFQPMARYVALSVSQRTFAVALVGTFGVLALLLAIAGVYGVVSYVVRQHHREIGIRLALGASPGNVCWMIVQQVLVVALAGMSVGSVVAAASTTALTPLLFEVGRFDVSTTLAVAALLALAALVASYAPVLRAGRVDPAAALRTE